MKSLTLVEIDVPSWVPTSPETVETWRFAMPTDYLPMEFDAIPSINSLDISPAVVSLGENLGERAVITVTFADHRHQFAGEPWTQGTFWGKWRGRFGTKLRGRPFRIIRGALGDPLEAMETRHFIIEMTDGPTPAGTFTIVAKDVLKLADDDRSQAPLLSSGELAGTINDATTSATLSPTGIGNAEYPASGWVCIGGNEVCAFTRSGDALTLTRAQLGSVASQHDAGERVQIVLRYPGTDAADIAYDLLTTYAGVDPALIDLPAWQAETAAHLGVIYARTITEPTAVKELLSQLVEQASLAIWWSDLANQMRLQVLKEISTDAATFDEDTIVEGSLRVSEQPGKRMSQVWAYFTQRDPTDQSDEADNYARARIEADLALQGEYGSPEIRKISAPWIATLSAAERLTGIQLSRYRNPPRKFNFSLFHDQAVALAGGYNLRWRFNQDETGLEVPAPIQITRIRREADFIHVEAEEMLASGVIVLTNTVFLATTGSVLSWTVPASWNDDDNEIHVIGGGGGGGVGSNLIGGGGGGGGAYSGIVNANLTPAASVSYRVGAGGASETSGGDTWFGDAVFGSALVGAKGGVGPTSQTGGAGGAAASGIGTVKTSGGAGGIGSRRGTTKCGAGGGGGAGGPSGNGGKGGGETDTSGDNMNGGAGGGGADGGAEGSRASGDTGAPGGHNRFGFGGGTSSSPNGKQGGGGRGGDSRQANPGLGGNGQELWTQSVAPIISGGPGGGGGGGGDNDNGRGGGLYGGGGGGAGGDGSLGGVGAQGIIVISWREAS